MDPRIDSSFLPTALASGDAARVLRVRRAEIVARWSEIVSREVAGARIARGPALIDQAPAFVDLIADRLEDTGGACPQSFEIGRAFAGAPPPIGYEATDLLREYQFLARVILDQLDDACATSRRAREVTLGVLQTASQEALARFVRAERYRDPRPSRLDEPLAGWRGVGFSLFGVAGITGVQLALWPLIRPATYILYFPMVIVLALYANGWAGIVLTLILAQYYFAGEQYSWAMEWPQDYARGVIFLASGALIMFLRHQVSWARARAYHERGRSLTFSRLQNSLAEVGRVGVSSHDAGHVLTRTVALVAEALDDVRVTYRSGEAGTEDGVRSVPVPGQHGPVGHLRLELGTGRRLSVDETNYLATVAGTLANVLERRQIDHDLRRSEDRLRQVNEELGRSNAELSRFAAIAAHDLKAPLNTVSQYAELVREATPPSTDTAPYFDTIAFATDRMRNLVDRLLSYSRVGALDAKPTAVETSAVLDGVRLDLDAAITASGARLTNDPLPIVHGDPVGLRQLFQNLIANALKFVAPGVAPRVHVAVRADGDRWRFEVRDNGIGVEPREAAEIFEPFRRLRAGSYEGTGLGLAICLRIVERHGGEIWMESIPGHGSNCIFTLPRVST